MLKESSMSDRFDVENVEAHERNATYVPELAMTDGQAWSSSLTVEILSKDWRLRASRDVKGGDLSHSCCEHEGRGLRKP
jgi:hypothetical protein